MDRMDHPPKEKIPSITQGGIDRLNRSLINWRDGAVIMPRLWHENAL